MVLYILIFNILDRKLHKHAHTKSNLYLAQEWQTKKTRLTVDFRNSANIPKKKDYIDQCRLSITSQKARITNLYKLDTTYVTQYYSRVPVA